MVSLDQPLLRIGHRSVVSDSVQPHGDYNLPGSSVHGILQARILDRVVIPFSRGSSRPRDRICFLHDRQILYHLSYLSKGHGYSICEIKTQSHAGMLANLASGVTPPTPGDAGLGGSRVHTELRAEGQPHAEGLSV